MNITIHRGINQIGGCITEIATDTTRILIDLGQNLPNGDGVVQDNLANKKSIETLTKGIDAIFFTHYHGDHIGLFHLVPDGIPQYIGSVAKQIALCKHQRLSHIPGREELSAREIAMIERMNAFRKNQVIQIGDIRVTPYFVSHSAGDAYMFLIEADRKRILHTGDFRDHGYLGKGLLKNIRYTINRQGRIDILITEGTMLSRMNEKVKHENDLKLEAIRLMKQYKNVFVMCSSTDMERLATFYSAHRTVRKGPFVCDDFQGKILKIFSETSGKVCALFDFRGAYVFSKTNAKLVNWMHDKGFCMLVRPTEKFIDYLASLDPLDKSETVLIYSMWKEYINPTSKHAVKRYLDFVERFPNVKILHTSGHASAECLTKVCNLVNPTMGIIPIHSEQAEDYGKQPILEELKGKIITRSVELGEIRVVIPN